MNTASLTFTVMDPIVEIGRDPEMADYGNPTGAIYGVCAMVVAEDDRGERRSLHVATGHRHEVLPRAQALAEALTARFAAGRLPVGFDRWSEEEPAYGSEAYVAGGHELQRWAEERAEAGVYGF